MMAILFFSPISFLAEHLPPLRRALSRFSPNKNEKTSEGLQIPCAAAGVLARKRHCYAIPFFL